MKATFAALLALCGVAALFGSTEAAQKCYVCTSATSNGCRESFTKDDNVLEQTCSNDCFKSYVKIGNLETYARGCSAGCTETGGGSAWMKCCNGKDYCNGASAATATMATLFTVLLARYAS